MAVKVYTYNNPKEWYKHSLYAEIKNQIHITATRNLAEGIEDRYRDDKKGEFQYIFTINEVVSKVFYDWHSPKKIMSQYLSLSRTINAIVEDERYKNAFKNNSGELLETIRMLVFCGLEPDSINPVGLSKKERLFLKIWKALERENGQFNEIRRAIAVGSTKAQIIKKLDKILKNECDGTLPPISEKRDYKIILHGFYFITPEQQTFLKYLERSGFELIFFQYYDKRFPGTFDFVRKFISNKYGWTDQWCIEDSSDQSKPTLGYQFLKTFEIEEKRVILDGGKREIIAYDCFHDFLEAAIIPHNPIGISKKNKDVQYIATNADILNGILVQYYPEIYADKRNFLHYPVGQFFLKIHEMWENGRLILNRDILLSTFSSGWLHDGKTLKNAREYTFELERILPFFENCRYVEDWLERIDFLLDIYDSILPLFEEKGDDRVVESNRSPFSRLSHFSAGSDKIRQIRSFILMLKNMAVELFDLKSQESSINEHFSRLLELVRKHNPINQTILRQEETEIINKIETKLSGIDGNEKFLYEDVGMAIQFYLSGKFSKKLDSGDDDELIKPFIEVDGEVFKKYNKKVYLTGLDEEGLPLSEFRTPWPFRDETYKKLAAAHPVLGLDLLRNKSVKNISRYLLFMALEFLDTKCFELSWMRNFLDRENLQPAVYVHYLNLDIKDYRLPVEEKKGRKDKQEDRRNIFLTEKEENEKLEKYGHIDLLVEYALCPRRFYYGYILDKYATFSDDFIHQFIYSEIIKFVKRSTDLEDNDVLDVVGKLFPQWTRFKKINRGRASLRYAKGGVKLEPVNGEVSISLSRKRFQFPGLKNSKLDALYQKVSTPKKMDTIIGKIKDPIDGNPYTMDAKSGYHCRFCPFLDFCSEGSYAVDEEKK